MLQDSEKKKIAIIADSRRWALGNIAYYIVNNLSNKYDFTVFYTEDYSNISELFIELFKDSTFDLVHFLFRKNLFTIKILNPFNQSACSNEWTSYVKGIERTKITASVYDHLYLGASDIKKHAFYLNCVIDSYTVSSNKLFKIYSGISDYPTPDAVIEDGVDTTRFTPKTASDIVIENNQIVVGWVGNSHWGMEDGFDHKGLHSIINPALTILKDKGFSIVSKFADRNETLIPYEKMPQYYQEIDVLLCASDIEGTPNPVLEAMASGIPVISTDVGVVPQVFGPLQKRYILAQRTPEAMAEKLEQLIINPEERRALVDENLCQIRDWTRNNEAEKWDGFFSKHLMGNATHRFSNERVRAGIIKFQMMITYLGDLKTKIQNRPVYIWGAGQAGEMTLDYLKKNGLATTGFIDRDPQKIGLEIENIPVFPPAYLEDLIHKGNLPFVFIGSSHFHAIRNQLLSFGFKEEVDFMDCDFLWNG